jgi:hypothetical protein
VMKVWPSAKRVTLVWRFVLWFLRIDHFSFTG